MTKSFLIVLTLPLASLAASTANAQFSYLNLDYTLTSTTTTTTSTTTTSQTQTQTQTETASAPTVVLMNGVLTIEGTDQDDTCRLVLQSSRLWVGLMQPSGAYDWRWFEEGSVKRVVFHGNAGDDMFYISSGAHLMDYGLHQFHCHLYGGTGLDYLAGGAGNDILDGGYDKSDDVLVGNGGADEFVIGYRMSYWGEYFVQYESILDYSKQEGDQVAYELQ